MKTNKEQQKYSLKKIIKENKLLKERIKAFEIKLQEVDRQIFYLKTLYDINQEIAPLANIRQIIKGFLMMIVGTFGIFNAFIILIDRETKITVCFESRSLERAIFQPILDFFKNDQWKMLSEKMPLTFFDKKVKSGTSLTAEREKKAFNLLVEKNIYTFLPFTVNKKYYGAIALGERITGEPFSQMDCELLYTFVSQMVVNISNIKSFEVIKELSRDIKGKNKILEDSVNKIHMLEDAKTLLYKFVPRYLKDTIETYSRSPDFSKKNLDVSVLFLDLDEYIRLGEKLAYEEGTQVIETYFSYFIDDIIKYGGDINMNLGNRLMIIFHDENQNKHALNAIKTALAIKDKTKILNEKMRGFIEPFLINIGIHSGTACVGINRIEGYYGSRWTYTAFGPTINVASKIVSFAKKGDILISDNTMSRIKGKYLYKNLGLKQLENLNKKIHIYRILGPVVT